MSTDFSHVMTFTAAQSPRLRDPARPFRTVPCRKQPHFAFRSPTSFRASESKGVRKVSRVCARRRDEPFIPSTRRDLPELVEGWARRVQHPQGGLVSAPQLLHDRREAIPRSPVGRPTRPAPARGGKAQRGGSISGPAVRTVGTQDAAARRSGKRRQGGGDFPAREQNTFLCDPAGAGCDEYSRSERIKTCSVSAASVRRNRASTPKRHSRLRRTPAGPGGSCRRGAASFRVRPGG